MVAITVGVACYNLEGYVEHCIRSIFDQSFTNFEIIAIDDGSTDSTGDALDSLVAGDRRLRVLHQENMGLGPVKNRIVREARGAFLTFVDADDWIAPDCLAESHRRAVADDLDILAFGWVRVEDGTSRVIKKRHDHRGRSTGDRDGMRRAAFSTSLNQMSCASLVRRRLFLNHALSYPACLHEDIYVTPFLYFYGRRYGYADRDLYYWRVRDGSVTKSISKSHIDGFVGSFAAWRKRLLMEGAYDEFREYAIRGLVSYLSLSHRRIKDFENGDPELLSYLKSRALSITELLDLEKYIPWEERYYHTEMDRILKHESSIPMAETFPRLYAANDSLRQYSAGKRPRSTPHGARYDICFAPHKNYHATTAFPIAERLRRDGLKVAFLHFSSIGQDEGAKERLARLGETHCHDVADFLYAGHSFAVLVVFNDWDERATRSLVRDAREAGAATVGFVEGINDFHDMDTGRRRAPYRTVEWVLGTGEDDRRYFGDMGSKFQVVGFPRITESLRQPYRPPAQRRAVINVNFSYGVLEDERERWLASAIEGCRRAGLDYVLSQHPRDRADLSGHPVDPRGFADSMRENAILVSRFSSCIIEALTMGRPVVYHNPAVEKVEKFGDPLGAYSLATDPESLAKSLERELAAEGSVVHRRDKFLKEHCDVSRDFRPHEKAARALMKIHTAHRARSKTTARKQSAGYYGLVRDFALRLPTPARIAGGLRRRVPRLTALALGAGLALTGAGIFDLAWGAWPAAAGLPLVGLVVMKEAILWRWRRARDRTWVESRIRRIEKAPAEALGNERSRTERALAETLLADPLNGNAKQQGSAMNTLTESIDELHPWWQRINLGSAITPGKWDVERQAEFLMKEAPWSVSGRILDAGANAGGVSIALQPHVDSIVCVEPDTRYVKQFRFVAEHIDTSKIEFKQKSLYKSHELGTFNVILMLGLFYHTRHPQLFLDYCSNLKAKRFVFSTQHIAGDGLTLLNRKEVYKKSSVMMGWQPTKSTMIGMLQDAGFAVDKAVPVLGNRSAAWAAGFTNSLYLFCTLERPVQTDIDSIVRISECPGSWT